MDLPAGQIFGQSLSSRWPLESLETLGISKILRTLTAGVATMPPVSGHPPPDQSLDSRSAVTSEINYTKSESQQMHLG